MMGLEPLLFTPEWAFMILYLEIAVVKNGGGYRSRTDDLLRARQAL